MIFRGTLGADLSAAAVSPGVPEALAVEAAHRVGNEDAHLHANISNYYMGREVAAAKSEYDVV